MNPDSQWSFDPVEEAWLNDDENLALAQIAEEGLDAMLEAGLL